MLRSNEVTLTRRDFLKVAGLSPLALQGCLDKPQESQKIYEKESMQKRRLGRTNLYVSVIGIGGGVIRNAGQVQVVREAIALGVNFIDTAHAYGKSERVIGEAIKGMRDKIYIATKTGERFSEGARHDIEESLKRLKTERIDILQMHAVGDFKALKAILDPNKGALLAAREFQKQGKVDFIGITGAHSPVEGRNPRNPSVVVEEAEVMKRAIKTGGFDTIQISCHIEWHAQELIELAKEHDMGVIVKKPLGAGKLIEKYGAKRLLQFVLENPDIHTAIPGMANVGQVREDVPLGYKS